MVTTKDRKGYREAVQRNRRTPRGRAISLHQFVWALIVSRYYLWRFLQREAFACNVVELYGELELHHMLTQFFDRAVYYGVLAYGKAEREESEKAVLSGVAIAREATLNRNRPTARRSRNIR